MKLCIDLDGTIANNKKNNETYEEVEPIENSVEVLTELKNQGCYIIIYTARNMGTYKNNLGLVIKNQAKITIDWLEKWKVPYDELLFGKPNVDYFIDDKAIQFDNWLNIKNKIMEKVNV